MTVSEYNLNASRINKSFEFTQTKWVVSNVVSLNGYSTHGLFGQTATESKMKPCPSEETSIVPSKQSFCALL